MIKLTDEMHQFLDSPPGHLNPCIIATADLSGTPNAGFIGTVFAIDEDTLCYRDRSGKNPLDHIESNPKVLVLFRIPGEDTGWKFRCQPEVYREGPQYDYAIRHLVDSGVQSDPSVQSAIVYLKIDQILSLYGEILQERNPGLEW